MITEADAEKAQSDASIADGKENYCLGGELWMAVADDYLALITEALLQQQKEMADLATAQSRHEIGAIGSLTASVMRRQEDLARYDSKLVSAAESAAADFGRCGDLAFERGSWGRAAIAYNAAAAAVRGLGAKAEDNRWLPIVRRNEQKEADCRERYVRKERDQDREVQPWQKVLPNPATTKTSDPSLPPEQK